MKFNGSDSHSHRWGVILAGGDGKRLLPLTRKLPATIVPSNFVRSWATKRSCSRLNAGFRD